MGWIAPELVVPDEPFVGDERLILDGHLDRQRGLLLNTCAGFTGEQLARRSVPPSSLSLLGLLRHLADVERNWFRRRFAGANEPPIYARTDNVDAAFDELDGRTAEADYRALVEEQQSARAAVASLPLSHVFVSPKWGPMSLRWVYSHMIREYAGHNGHADLLRECLIDGEREPDS
jgi:hypothetical protein